MISGILVFSLLTATLTMLDDVPPASPVYAGIAVGDAEKSADVAPPEDVPESAPHHTPLVSINTDILDMSWTGAMDLSDPMLRPSGIILPFLDAYPIDNLEVKLRLLNLRF